MKSHTEGVHVARSKYKEAPIGNLFGYWEVIGYSHYENEHYWIVKCTLCGKVKSRRASQLTLGRSKSCRSCLGKMRESDKSPYWKGLNGMTHQYLSRLPHRGKEVSLTMEDLYDQWELQGGKCAFTGEALSLEDAKDKKASTASIDRVNSSLGYIKGNIQWVHKRINLMKSNMADEDFINMCNKVSLFRGSCGL